MRPTHLQPNMDVRHKRNGRRASILLPSFADSYWIVTTTRGQTETWHESDIEVLGEEKD